MLYTCMFNVNSMYVHVCTWTCLYVQCILHVCTKSLSSGQGLPSSSSSLAEEGRGRSLRTPSLCWPRKPVGTIGMWMDWPGMYHVHTVYIHVHTMYIHVHTYMFRILHIPLHYKPLVLVCTAMYSVYTMLLRIEWQFGIYMVWKMYIASKVGGSEVSAFL